MYQTAFRNVILCGCASIFLTGLLLLYSPGLHFLLSVDLSTFRAPLQATPLAPLKASSHLIQRLTATPPSLSSVSRAASSDARQEESNLQLNTTKKLLCHTFKGRLGNELFQYSSTMGLALTLNRTPVFLGGKYMPTVLKTFFVPQANFTQLRLRCARARAALEASPSRYDERLARLNSRYDFKVVQYLNSYRYFEKHEAHIRKALTFSDAIRNKSEQFVRHLRQKYNSSTTFVGFHLRRGDTSKKHMRKSGYPLATPEHANRSVAFFEKRYPNCVFVVASDDLPWWREHFPRGHNVVFVSGKPRNEPAVDMLILASMDHTAISFGTFSWWVGYLNNGTTAYMKDIIIPNTFIGRSYLPGGEGYIYPGWIPV